MAAACLEKSAAHRREAHLVPTLSLEIGNTDLFQIHDDDLEFTFGGMNLALRVFLVPRTAAPNTFQ
jgi:hypothetical protein